MYLDQINCCGILEAGGIRGDNTDETMKDLYRQLAGDYEYRGAYVLFTDHIDMKYGLALAAYIRKNKLGKVYSIPSRLNTNSANRVRAWMWAYDRKKVTAHAKKKRWKLPVVVSTGQVW